MSLPILIRPLAQDDIVCARDWYDQKRPGLGDDFVAAVEMVIDRIRSMPESYAVIRKNARAALTPTFSYLVFYRILTHCIEVLALVHGSRHSREWKNRL